MIDHRTNIFAGEENSEGPLHFTGKTSVFTGKMMILTGKAFDMEVVRHIFEAHSATII